MRQENKPAEEMQQQLLEYLKEMDKDQIVDIMSKMGYEVKESQAQEENNDETATDGVTTDLLPQEPQ